MADNLNNRRLFTIINTWLIYIRNTNLYNMVSQFSDAYLSALLCARFVGDLTREDIDTIYSSPLFHEWAVLDQYVTLQPSQAMENHAASLPYSPEYMRLAEKYPGNTPKTSLKQPPAAQLFVETVRNIALQKGRTIRRLTGIGADATTDYEIMWYGLRLWNDGDEERYSSSNSFINQNIGSLIQNSF
jgi:hypothetical protein